MDFKQLSRLTLSSCWWRLKFTSRLRIVFRTGSFVVKIILIIFKWISWVYWGVSVYIFLTVKRYRNIARRLNCEGRSSTESVECMWYMLQSPFCTHLIIKTTNLCSFKSISWLLKLVLSILVLSILVTRSTPQCFHYWLIV